MLEIQEEDESLLLVYAPEGPHDWVAEKLSKDKEVTIKKVFTFATNHSLSDFAYDEDDVSTHTFRMGTLNDAGYYVIDSGILGLQHNLRLYRDMKIDVSTFVATRNISIFRKIDALVDEPIVVGGPDEEAIPIEDFSRLVHDFPTTTELNHYSAARITRVLKEYFDTMTDAQKRLDAYMAKRRTLEPKSKVDVLFDAELEKYLYIRDTVQEMLQNVDEYSERDWQKHMIDFLLLLFPKYVAVLDNVPVKDFYSCPSKPKDRFGDIVLVDASGNIDLVEIKKPFPHSLLSTGKYRDSFTPKRELSGAVIQAEKYLFHLTKWGVQGERKLTERFRSRLPKDMEIRIRNPKAMVIAGRDNDFDDRQTMDFEIIRRKYANIADVITYDDLLRRLKNIIDKFHKKNSRKNGATTSNILPLGQGVAND